MGVEFKLSDRELPASPAFVRFLATVLFGVPQAQHSWADQVSEQLARAGPDESRIANEAAARVMNDAAGRELVARAYGLLVALLSGDLAPLTEFQSRFRFVSVVGIPRTGGSYLVAEHYRALGLRPDDVPGVLAHDSFPDAGPFALDAGMNSWVNCLKTTAEYMVMVELFFGDRPRHSGRVVVPKKLTQAMYAAGFFLRVLGSDTVTLLTLRHPVAACVSTYEKSGGLPPDGRFAVRSNIEEWCRRDLEYTGCGPQRLAGMDYFDVYLRYWENYYLSLVTNGLCASPGLRILAYGKDSLESFASQCHRDYGSTLPASGFHVSSDAARRHGEWIERARPSIERVAAAWRVVGLSFPVDEIARCV